MPSITVTLREAMDYIALFSDKKVLELTADQLEDCSRLSAAINSALDDYKVYSIVTTSCPLFKAQIDNQPKEVIEPPPAKPPGEDDLPF